MKRLSYSPPQSQPVRQNVYHSWQDVTAHGVDLDLTTIVTGHLYCQNDRLINLKHPNTRDIKPEIVKIPILVHLVKHPTLGNYLIDTGLDSSYQTNPMGRTKGLLVRQIMAEGIQEKDQNIVTYLTKHGINLSGIFVTHFHMDHMAGLWDLPKNVPCIIPKGEKPVTVFPFVYDDYLSGIDTLYEIDTAKGQTLAPFDGCVDVFGDASLWAIPTPGHTKHHISFLVNRKGNPTLLTADACHFELCLERKTGPGAFAYDVRLAQENLLKIIGFMEKYPDVRIVCGHSPA
jgi:glyoxylase-like metal-dependent hydrolase (beta-lactamase superfamily II)